MDEAQESLQNMKENNESIKFEDDVVEEGENAEPELGERVIKDALYSEGQFLTVEEDDEPDSELQESL